MLMYPGLEVFLSRNLGEDDWVQGVDGTIYVNGARTTISAALLDVSRYLLECYEHAAAALISL